ncbi:MAG TPA: YlxR family protein [Chloroflexota bacterium]|nr:YlxR family protein [Chloroflexota bacterium]
MAAQATAPKKAAKTRAPRPLPERTCVACRVSRPKRHLVRLVRTAEGTVEVDKTGKRAGRGAYLCPAQVCWRLARTRKSLDQALAVTVTAEAWVALDTYAERLPVALRERVGDGEINGGTETK